jgi:hypothetical protein
MANFAYGEEREAERSELSKLAEILLRDQCVLSFRRSFDKVASEREREGYKSMIKEVNTLIKLALMVTDHLDT